MVYQTVVKAGIQKHKGMLLGIFSLILLVSLLLGTVLTVWVNAASYSSQELARAGFGDLTAWVAGTPSTAALADQIAALEPVEQVQVQPLAFANYTANGQESDSQGQLIAYTQQENRYRFFTDNLEAYQASTPTIAVGTVYASPALISMFSIKIGDTIDFSIARNGGTMPLTVKGFYEDPFMGSAMIGMKGFLIAPADASAIAQMVDGAGIDALAQNGAMLHIFGSANATTAQLNTAIHQNTQLAQYTEFTHSKQAIGGLMLVLQNAFSALLIAFVVVLLLVVLVALGHGITSNIQADYVNMGILKALGFTSTRLRVMQLLQYLACIVPAMLLGLGLTAPLSRLIGSATLSTTGVLVPATPPWGVCLGAFALVLGVLCGFIVLQTAKMKAITPLHAITGAMVQATPTHRVAFKINGARLQLSLAVRQLITGKKQYISAGVVAILLVFFATTIGRMNAWLGADGKGMMDAFNPADHHLGVQLLGQHSLEDAKALTLTYTQITSSYQLAMVSTAVNGRDYTANVITQPERFHILKGQTCAADNQIVVTEFVAADLGVTIGDTVTLTGDKGSGAYQIAGIYACANNMGDTIGMSQQGYLRIAQDNPQIWCDHYFLADNSQKPAITQALTDRFGGDVHVHENTWPGLQGIVAAMQALLVFLYAMVLLFVLVVTTMTASRILVAQQRDMGIYKAIGFTCKQLRFSFALRFGIVAGVGAAIGVALSIVLSDLLVSNIMKFAGISNFASNPSVFALGFPAIFVTLLFTGFAYVAAAKIKRTNLTILVTP